MLILHDRYFKDECNSTFILKVTRLFIRTVLIFIFSFNLFATEQPLVVFTEEFPPYNFLVNNEITGINIRLVEAACEAANIECVFELLPWNRALRNALEGPNSGLVSAARTSERENMFQWVGPFISGQNCIYKLASRTDIEVSNIAVANKYVMGASTDSAYTKLLTYLGFEEGKNLKLYPGKYTMVRPFAAQRVDLMIGSATSIQKQLSHADLKLSDIVPVAKIDSSLLGGNYLALHPGIDQGIVKRLQTSLNEIISSGMANQIELEFVKPIVASSSVLENDSLWNACIKEDRALANN